MHGLFYSRKAFIRQEAHFLSSRGLTAGSSGFIKKIRLVPKILKLKGLA